MWTLIIFLYAGTFSKSDSVALDSISGFSSYNLCEEAGEDISELETLFKNSKYICVRTGEAQDGPKRIVSHGKSRRDHRINRIK